MISSMIIPFCLVTVTVASMSEHDSTEESCALQVTTLKVQGNTCSIGDSVSCPHSGDACKGNQCCPGTKSSGGKTFPCPSADPDWESECESPRKVTDCVATDLFHCVEGPEAGTSATELSGYYVDLQDADNKKIKVESGAQATLVITPPPPSSCLYRDTIGKNWKVVAALLNNCVATMINFNVPNKPNPPPFNVSAAFTFGPVGDLDFVKGCLKTDIDHPAAENCKHVVPGPEQLPQIGCGDSVWSLDFGGNAWVKLDE